MTFVFRAVGLVIAAVVFAIGSARSEPPIEAYGAFPDVREVKLSPDGSLLSMISFMEGREFLLVINADRQTIAALDMQEVKARTAYFASSEHIVLLASDTMKFRGYRGGPMEYSAAFGFDIAKRKATQLLRKGDLYPVQSGLGRIIGLSDSGKYAYMPAFSDKRPPTYDVFKTELDSTRGARSIIGKEDTIDWFIDTEGNPVLREDYDRRRGIYEVYAYDGKKDRLIHRLEGLGRSTSSVIGIMPDGRHALYYEGQDEAPGDTKYVLLSLADGSKSPVDFVPDDKGISSLITTTNGVILGLVFDGMTPEYHFFDDRIDEIFQEIQKYSPNVSIFIESWTDDFSQVVLLLEGNGSSGQFVRFDMNTLQAEFLASQRPAIAAEDVAPIEVFTYKARDGLEIEAVLTGAPAAGEPARPLILLPHGGPASRDMIGFDWQAQYLARRGYTVLQPNFRGSTGYGKEFMDAGRGEWGAKMQDDLSDGVLALAATGRIDPDRVCIMGGSYGGYAALMGGATTPELYRCVIAIAPVTDTKRMLREELRSQGADSPALDYWKEQLGVEDLSDELLKGQSPVNLAENFDDPVLLIHGKDDTVVPLKHSREMEEELRRAGKSVRLVILDDEDHWLSRSETRLRTLQEIDAFLAEHLPVE